MLFFILRKKGEFNLQTEFKRGDVYYYDFGEKNSSIQAGLRPVVILQNDTGNKHSPTTIVAAMTTKKKTNIPTHVSLFRIDIKMNEKNMKFSEIFKIHYSTILFEQIFTVNKKDLKNKVGEIDLNTWEMKEALKISLGIN